MLLKRGYLRGCSSLDGGSPSVLPHLLPPLHSLLLLQLHPSALPCMVPSQVLTDTGLHFHMGLGTQTIRITIINKYERQDRP